MNAKLRAVISRLTELNGTDVSDPRFCEHRWSGPRPEVADTTVQHVCGEPYGHAGAHRCTCGMSDD